MTNQPDARLSSPAVLRNRPPILDVLCHLLPPQGIILGVASGSGEHITYLAEQLPSLEWQPSDPSPIARASIAAWTAADRLTNVRPPLDLDASALPWPVSAADAIMAINMVHISPWAATQGLLREAARLLPSGGLFYLYGPFIQAGIALAPSNAAFDADLRDRNIAWGLRDLAAVAAAAAESGSAGRGDPADACEQPLGNRAPVSGKSAGLSERLQSTPTSMHDCVVMPALMSKIAHKELHYAERIPRVRRGLWSKAGSSAATSSLSATGSRRSSSSPSSRTSFTARSLSCRPSIGCALADQVYLPWPRGAADEAKAIIWFKHQPIPQASAAKTAQALAHRGSGRTCRPLTYLDQLNHGIYA